MSAEKQISFESNLAADVGIISSFIGLFGMLFLFFIIARKKPENSRSHKVREIDFSKIHKEPFLPNCQAITEPKVPLTEVVSIETSAQDVNKIDGKRNITKKNKKQKDNNTAPLKIKKTYGKDKKNLNPNEVEKPDLLRPEPLRFDVVYNPLPVYKPEPKPKKNKQLNQIGKVASPCKLNDNDINLITIRNVFKFLRSKNVTDIANPILVFGSRVTKLLKPKWNIPLKSDVDIRIVTSGENLKNLQMAGFKKSIYVEGLYTGIIDNIKIDITICQSKEDLFVGFKPDLLICGFLMDDLGNFYGDTDKGYVCLNSDIYHIDDFDKQIENNPKVMLLLIKYEVYGLKLSEDLKKIMQNWGGKIPNPDQFFAKLNSELKKEDAFSTVFTKKLKEYRIVEKLKKYPNWNYSLLVRLKLNSKEFVPNSGQYPGVMFSQKEPISSDKSNPNKGLQFF